MPTGTMQSGAERCGIRRINLTVHETPGSEYPPIVNWLGAMRVLSMRELPDSYANVVVR